MGTVADKLNKLLSTKADIKAAITEKGQAVAGTDTFASYADKIRAIETASRGMEWAESAMPGTGWFSIAYGNGVFVAISNGTQKAAYSTDGGKTWTEASMPSRRYWQSVTYGGGIFLAVAGETQEAAYSTDGGKTWTETSLPSSSFWEKLDYGGGVFVALSTVGKLAYSTDGGKTWTESAHQSGDSWKHIAYGGGVFVAVEYSKAAYSSIIKKL